MEDLGLPTHCPICNHSLEWKGVDLVCPNKNCDNIKQADLEIWTEIVGEIEGIKWLTKKKYLDELEITTVEELHNYINNVLPISEESYISVTDKKMLEVFNKLKSTHPLEKGLQALNIERLGQSSSEKLGRNKQSFETILKFAIGVETEINWSIIENLVGQATMNTIRDNQEKLKRLNLLVIKKFEEPVIMEQKGTFCITGKLNSGSRDSMIKLAESKGWKSLSKVTKECNYLVTNDKTSGSSKNKKAQELGTKIIDEEEFLSMINE